MGVSVTVASYSTTIAIVVAGVAPLIYSPISNLYGRRPVYIITTAIGIAANAGCAVAKSWGPFTCRTSIRWYWHLGRNGYWRLRCI